MPSQRNTTVVATLADRLDGELLTPGDDGYDEARSVWNAMIDRRPRLIARCASPGDVAVALRFARERGLEVGVRCGGHSVLGHAVPDDGLMIDLSPMDAVRVDPVARRAWVQGGALLGALDRAAQVHGLATTAGNVSHTGVGGLTLGGGMGWLARRCGLACDNVVAFELVTADGALLHVTADRHPDLFWALRGGGGNFGVVTEFEFRLHAVGTRALIADFYFDVEDALGPLKGWRELSARAPREATFTSTVLDIAGRALCSVGFVWVGDPARGREWAEPLRALGRPLSAQVHELSYLDLQTKDDDVQGHALRRYWSGHYLRALPDEALVAYLGRGGSSDHPPVAGLQAYGGAIAEAESAFSHRETLFEYVAAARWEFAREDAERIASARAAARALDPFAAGAYVNVDASVERAFSPDTLERLRAIKATYDPDNVFHLNQNITPAG